jgi:hypothetical protein
MGLLWVINFQQSDSHYCPLAYRSNIIFLDLISFDEFFGEEKFRGLLSKIKVTNEKNLV